MSILGIISDNIREIGAAVVFTGILTIIMTVEHQLSKRQGKNIIKARLSSDEFEIKTTHGLGPLWQCLENFGTHFLPSTEKETESAKKLIMYAGYSSGKAIERYYGIRAAIAFGLSGLFLIFLLATGRTDVSQLLFTTIFLGIGYYAPHLLLVSRVRARNRIIFRELPNTIDLLVICIEAGLGFEMALYRVSRELKGVAPILSHEFERYFHETKGGVSRKKALEALKERSGEQGLRAVVDVILQSLKFGTDISQALRVHSEAMRKKRQQLAEEKGGKVAVKLTLPLVVFILPVLLIIILGPAIMNLVRQFS